MNLATGELSTSKRTKLRSLCRQAIILASAGAIFGLAMPGCKSMHHRASADARITLQGTVVRMPWSKSAESWDAGGSDYYVLLTNDGASPARHILRASQSVTVEQISRHADKQVVVRGQLLEPQPYTPASSLEQYPTDADGKPAPRGSGFRVDQIRVLNPQRGD